MSQHDYDQKPNITVVGIGGAGGNAVNNMIESKLEGVDFVVANTDAQALKHSLCENRVQLGTGLGAGAVADVGRQAAEDSAEDIRKCLEGANMAFITAGMGGGTGTGAAPVVARIAKEMGILTIGVVTKPFQFEGSHRMRSAEKGIETLEGNVDTMIMIPNQNLFRVCDANTTFADAFKMADSVLHSGVRSVTDLIVMPGLINLDFADIRSVMRDMGKAMMGMGEGSGEDRATKAAQAAITNPLLDDVSMQGAQGVLINITGGMDMTLFEVDEVANRIREEVDPEAQIIFGSAFDETMEGSLRVSVVATGFDREAHLRRQKAVQEDAAKREEKGSGHPFTVVAGDKSHDEKQAEASSVEPAEDGDMAPDWLKPVADDDEPGNALADLKASEPEEETAKQEPEVAEEAEPAAEETKVEAEAAVTAEPETAGPEDEEEEDSVPLAADASTSVDEDLVEDVTNWITKAYIEGDATGPQAGSGATDSGATDSDATDSGAEEAPVAAAGSEGGSDEVAASLSKIWNEQGSSKKGESEAVNGHNGQNGTASGADVSSIFLDGSAEEEESKTEASGDDESSESLEAADDKGNVEADAKSDADRSDDDEGQGPSGHNGADESDDVSIEDDDEEDVAEVPQRASGFFSGLRRGFNKPSRDEQTGKAVLERLRGCQRLNTGEA